MVKNINPGDLSLQKFDTSRMTKTVSKERVLNYYGDSKAYGYIARTGNMESIFNKFDKGGVSATDGKTWVNVPDGNLSAAEQKDFMAAITKAAGDDGILTDEGAKSFLDKHGIKSDGKSDLVTDLKGFVKKLFGASDNVTTADNVRKILNQRDIEQDLEVKEQKERYDKVYQHVGAGGRVDGANQGNFPGLTPSI